LKLPSLFAVQTFILRLLLPTEIERHPTLASEFIRHFRAIFEYARPLSADLMRPLFSKVDGVCIELCQLVHEALLRFSDLSAAVFHTLIQRSESMLVFKNLSLTTTNSSFASFHGIINLGCTCYFNSITQQLFMIPGFAASVISAQVKIDAATAESNTPARCILEEFQDLMINLRHGSDPVVHPKTFCDSFRFPDGSCILPDVQQDALEYFHILCDHLDNALKGSHDEKLLSRFFGGRSATQLLCKGCPHRYERFEHFFTLQLAVFSNRANSVLGALQEFVAGELLEGDNQYFCSECNKKVDTVKRTVLADLPDTIILGLKRFDFNYDTMQRVKLNVEVPFSHDLDMSPFCRENLGETPADSEPAIIREPGYYQYSLAGIVATDEAMAPLLGIRTPLKVQALQRTLYRKAKENRRWRAWSLCGDLCRCDVLETAMKAVVANGGAAGMDGLTTEQVKAGAEEFLNALQAQLTDRSYQPGPVKRVWIPKAEGKQRPLGIPNVVDRIVQMALLILLQPIFEADFDEDEKPAPEFFGVQHGAEAKDIALAEEALDAFAGGGWRQTDLIGQIDSRDAAILLQELQDFTVQTIKVVHHNPLIKSYLIVLYKPIFEK
jgi:ubiquitin C-terminal hydrolase